MNKKLFYIFGWLFMSLMAFGGFNNAVETIWGDPIIKPWGTSTYLKDSTNYVTINKSLYVLDSMKMAKDLYVGTKGGVVYLDTNRKGRIYFSGSTLGVNNDKENGSLEFWVGEKSSEYYWFKSQGGSGYEMMQLDSIDGLSLANGLNIQTGSTGQIKIPSDTASDYDGNNSITLNRQSGFLTTKALTTANGSYYDLTLVNSLAGANSKLFVTVIYGGGSNTSAPCYPTHVTYTGGNWVIGLLNTSGSALNGTVKLSYIIFN